MPALNWRKVASLTIPARNKSTCIITASEARTSQPTCRSSETVKTRIWRVLRRRSGNALPLDRCCDDANRRLGALQPILGSVRMLCTLLAVLVPLAARGETPAEPEIAIDNGRVALVEGAARVEL